MNGSLTELERISALETDVRSVKDDIKEIGTGVIEIRNLLVRRPSWSVATFLAMQSTAIGVLAALLISQ